MWLCDFAGSCGYKGRDYSSDAPAGISVGGLVYLCECRGVGLGSDVADFSDYG